MAIKTKHSAVWMLIMTFILSAIILFVSALFEANAQSGYTFCDGWKAGYEAGYCYNDYYCIPPIAPLCPLPHVGMNTYEHGYNRGFLLGFGHRQSQ